jgi:acetylglutamate kinase
MVDGRRITDAQSLELVTMVYGGWASKTLVAGLQARGCNALGVSGADADLIRARKRPVSEIDFGLVGDVERVRSAALLMLLDSGLVPVFCALTHDGNGQLLNTNADSIAAALAVDLSTTYETTLIYCFGEQGVLNDVNDPESVIEQIDRNSLATLEKEGIISTGMIPKLFNSFKALAEGVDKVYIGPVSLLSGQARKFTQIRL